MGSRNSRMQGWKENDNLNRGTCVVLARSAGDLTTVYSLYVIECLHLLCGDLPDLADSATSTSYVMQKMHFTGAESSCDLLIQTLECSKCK